MTGPPAVALTIAGSDSGGGAGIAADLKTFAAFGVFGTLVVTAVTAQNTRTVSAIETLPGAMVEAQLDAVLSDFPVAAAKTGMLASAENVKAVAARAAAGGIPNLVVDPVMVAASGAALIPPEARDAYFELIPHALLLTPNLAEAEALLGEKVGDEQEMEEAARALCDLGAKAVLVKGGHRRAAAAADVLCFRGEISWLAADWVETGNVHGTGCTLSAAVAARLAAGDGLLDAVSTAKRYLTSALERSKRVTLGAGPGPLVFPGGD